MQNITKLELQQSIKQNTNKENATRPKRPNPVRAACTAHLTDARAEYELTSGQKSGLHYYYINKINRSCRHEFFVNCLMVNEEALTRREELHGVRERGVQAVFLRQ